MSSTDSTAIRFVRPVPGRTVIPLFCPMCGCADVTKTQAFAFDGAEAQREDESIVSGAHFQCDSCRARLTVRIEKHRVSIRWLDPV